MLSTAIAVNELQQQSKNSFKTRLLMPITYDLTPSAVYTGGKCIFTFCFDLQNQHILACAQSGNREFFHRCFLLPLPQYVTSSRSHCQRKLIPVVPGAAIDSLSASSPAISVYPP